MGVEGYVESAALGLITGRMAAAQALGNDFEIPPLTTAMGALACDGRLYDRSESQVPTDEYQFRPVSADRGRDCLSKIKGGLVRDDNCEIDLTTRKTLFNKV